MKVDGTRLGVEMYDSLKFVKFKDEIGVFYVQKIDDTTFIEPYLEEVGMKNGLVYAVVTGENIKRRVTDDGIGKPLKNYT